MRQADKSPGAGRTMGRARAGVLGASAQRNPAAYVQIHPVCRRRPDCRHHPSGCGRRENLRRRGAHRRTDHATGPARREGDAWRRPVKPGYRGRRRSRLALGHAHRYPRGFRQCESILGALLDVRRQPAGSVFSAVDRLRTSGGSAAQPLVDRASRAHPRAAAQLLRSQRLQFAGGRRRRTGHP